MTIVPTAPPSGRTAGAIAGTVLAALLIATRAGNQDLAPFLIPLAALIGAAAVGRRFARTRPDEPWLGRFLVLGMAAKVAASYIRYTTLVTGYGGIGDATSYDMFGRQFVAAWTGNGVEPTLVDMRQTNFIRWLTGVVYFLFGTNTIGGFLVYGVLAFIGSYLWYRATVDAVPFVNPRLYLAFVVFVPSILFWPSSIGKEALMQLGLGGIALATSLLLRGRLAKSMAVGLPSGWLIWVVRPHLLAMVTMAGAAAYYLGRVRAKNRGTLGSLVSRPIGLVIVGLLVAFTVTQGAQFLGLKDLSLSSIEQELNAETARTTQGGSSFNSGSTSLTPLSLPQGAVTVLLRPFPFETESAFQLIASVENTMLAALLVVRLSSLRAGLKRSRDHPFLLYCLFLLALYSITFSSFGNFGLLVRERSLVLPALYVLLAIDPTRAQTQHPAVEPENVSA